VIEAATINSGTGPKELVIDFGVLQDDFLSIFRWALPAWWAENLHCHKRSQ
jgi:hypothetical protein